MVAADLQTYYGNLGSHWKTENGQTLYEIEIPANTTADIFLPSANANNIEESGKAVSGVSDLKVGEGENGLIKITVGSGKYNFVVKK